MHVLYELYEIICFVGVLMTLWQQFYKNNAMHTQSMMHSIVCCWALLKAIYFTSFFFFGSGIPRVLAIVSLWYPYDLYFWDCCFVVVYFVGFCGA